MADLIKIRNKVRDYLHVVGFFTFAYWLLNMTTLYTEFYTVGKIIMCLFISVIGGYGSGVSYEYLKLGFFQNPISMNDINRSAIGFAIGTFLVAFFPGINFITTYLFWFCFGLFVLDLVVAIFNKYKKK